jgi:Mg-chelatase subunit ChlD
VTHLVFLILPLLALGCGSGDSKESDDTVVEDEHEVEDEAVPGEEPDCSNFKMILHEGGTDAPSVVRLVFQLTCDGEPVPGLEESDFEVFEDGESISVFESDQQIVPTVALYQLSTLLMLDMSGSMVESGNLPALQEAASTFIAKLGGDQEVAVYTFDGQESPTLLVPFTSDDELLGAGIALLTDYEVVDSSTNLNGAVLRGLALLDREAGRHVDKLFGGNLAIFTDGKDQAGRVADDVAADAAQASEHSVYTIGLGGEIAEGHLEDIGKDGALFAEDVDSLSEAFDEVAADILAEANSLYILAYCSPKRAGSHELKLKLKDTSAKLNYTFDAAGFEGGCDPDDFVPPEFLDADGDGYRPYDGDCDDTDASVHPGASDFCDGIDNDCDGVIDEDISETVYSDIFEVELGSKADILFFVDQSCSMEDDQARLAANFSTFISELNSYTEDWQIIVANKDSGCNSTSGVLTPSVPGYISRFQSGVSDGSGGFFYTEAGLTVTSEAIENTDSGECNEGFMRPAAMLHIIMVSDEAEQSPMAWSHYVDQIIAKKGDSSLVKFSAIAGDYPVSACESAEPGTGYYQAVTSTGGVFLSICSDWAEDPSAFASLAEASVGSSRVYPLSFTPIEETIQVFINGTERVSGWSYKSARNTVEFTVGVPEVGDTVRMDYLLSDCE